MKSKVYFLPLTDKEEDPIVQKKFSSFLDKVDPFAFIDKADTVAIKTHFGEDGNTGHIKPPYLKIVADKVLAREAKPFITDSNALYRGRRTFTKDHLKLAEEHGFTKAATGADIIIAEGLNGKDIASVPINMKFIKTAKIASFYIKADCIVAVSHFKGHLISGFGGAIKNIGMGCASREGKLQQHSNMSPFVDEKACVGCGACAAICPVSAISLNNKLAHIDSNKCIGCSECIATCPSGAMSIAWNSGVEDVQEKMAEYALGVLKNKKKRSLFINFALRISQECDCWSKDFPRISPDVGILLSLDPVAVDTASFHIVNKVCGKDVFNEAHPEIDGTKQLKHAEMIGLGSMEYELINVS
jgi:uncharacterized Fe-S center protein